MRALFTLNVFLGSFLLFLVQPMAALMVLPQFGGAPQVWNASLVFFQAGLLLGYLYTHLTARWLGPKRQAVLHVVLMAAAMITLPISIQANTSTFGDPALAVIASLAIGLGLPFTILSAGAPLVQRWFGSTRDPQAADPYFLYSASNAGSLAALFAYPLLLKPMLPLSEQSRVWAIGFGLLALFVGGCAFLLWRQPAQAEEQEISPTPAPEWRTRLTWIALAAVPSSLLMGVTTYLTTNIAPVPLLWVVPLALYLITYIAAFAGRRRYRTETLGRILPMLVTPLAIVVVLESSDPFIALALMHLITFFVIALMCHGRLADERPAKGHLTEFYLWLSVGGLLGGCFNALIAPVAFDVLLEYPIALVLALLLRGPEDRPVSRWLNYGYPVAVGLITLAGIVGTRMLGIEPGPATILAAVGIPALLAFIVSDRRIAYALSLAALFAVSYFGKSSAQGDVLFTERSFFGVHRVLATNKGQMHELVHGTTIHGRQDLKKPTEPLTYYHRTGPAGGIFKALQGSPIRQNVGLIGLGVGSLAAYGEAGERFVFYEIDPVVEEIAKDRRLFTFLSDCQADATVVLGDGRLSIKDAREGEYGLIVLDAFSSDAIPVHLLTKEAVQLYLSKLQPGGLIAFHISNRYLDLKPVLAGIAADMKIAGYVYEDLAVTDDEVAEGKTQSTWAILARSEADVQRYKLGWDPLVPRPGLRVWTDEFSDILPLFKMGGEESE